MHPTFGPLRAPLWAGFLSYLPPSMTGREQSLGTVSNKGKCRTSLLLPVLLYELGRAELRFFPQRGKDSRWGEEKKLALLLAFQSRNGFSLPLSGQSRAWSLGTVRNKERESVVLPLAVPCKTGNQRRPGFNPAQSEGGLMPDNSKHPLWSQCLLASGHTSH